MLNWILQNGLTVLGFGGYALVGLLAILGYFKKGSDDRRSEETKLADGLITRLQQTVDQNAKDMLKMQADMEKHTKDRDEQIRKLSDDLKHMQGRNSVLEDLFKGRDPAMQAFLKDAPSLIGIARENNGLAKEMAQGLGSLESTLAKFVDTLQPILIHFELKKPATAGGGTL